MQQKYLYILWIASLLQYCATPSAPQGGPRDETPPKVITSFPSNETVHFNADKIIIEFDENVTIDNPNQKVWITPKPQKFPDFHVRKNQIGIEFNESLLPNTTYNIAFGEAIKDVNEGNVISNYTYTFSTGDVIDSCSISGKVYATEIPDHSYILLYDTSDVNIVKSQRPSYIYALGKDGTFNIGNLAAKPYRIFALTDKNNNYLYDLPNEKIGFIDTLVHARDSVVHTTIVLFEEEKSSMKISSYNTTAPDNAIVVSFDFAENNLQPSLRMTDTLGGMPIYTRRIKGNEILFVFPDSGSTAYIVYIDDSIVDTINTKMLRSVHYNYFADYKFEKSNSFINNSPVFSMSDTIKLLIPNAVNIFEERIIIKDSSATVKDITIGSYEDSIYILGNWKDKTWYKAIFLDSAIQYIDWGFHYSTADTINFFTTDKKNLGAIDFVFPDDSNQYIFELYQDKKLIYNAIIRNDLHKLHLDNLMPDKYNFILVWDKNRDGRMTGGNFKEQRLPEPEYRPAEGIMVKPNWDQEIAIKPVWDNFRLNTNNTAKNINMNPKR